LSEQWASIQADFGLLTGLEQTDFTAKYSHINVQLDKAFLPKEEAYQQSLIVEKLANDKMAAKAVFDQQLHTFNQNLSMAVGTNTVLDENECTAASDLFIEDVNQSVLNSAEKQHYFKAINNHNSQVKKLPELVALVGTATELMEQMIQLTVPSSEEEYTEKSPLFDNWKKEWKTLEKKAQGNLPQSLISAFIEINKVWQTALKPFSQKQKQAFAQTQKKLADLHRLHTQGKFNACFGIYKGIQKSFAALNESQQQRLQRDFDQASENMVELSDWEHYIATPKK
jgi:hypothetical protein